MGKIGLAFCAVVLTFHCVHADVISTRDVASRAVSATFEPTEDYEHQKIEGFSVYISGRLVEQDRATVSAVKRIVRAQLYRLSLMAPRKTRLLRTTKIWFTKDQTTGTSTAHYIQSSAKGLESVGRNPDFASSIEVYNVPAFVRQWRHEPSVLIHELAHAYHHQHLEDGFHNKRIADLYNTAKATGKYDWVLRAGEVDRTQEHYASVNERVLRRDVRDIFRHQWVLSVREV